MPAFDVVGFGIATTDHLGIIDRFPVEDTKQRLLAYTQQGGGTVGTPLVACARLGARPAYLGRMGNGPSSRFILDDFSHEGVDTSRVIREPGYEPPVGLILVNPETRSRTIAWHASGAAPLAPDRLDRAIIEASRLLYLDAHESAASAAAAGWARGRGRIVMIDADNYTEGIDRVLPLCGVIIGSHVFASEYAEDSDGERAAARLSERFGGTCAVTVGEDGSYVACDDGCFHQPAYPVEVIDTTGAGDVFHGAFAVGLLEGWPVQSVAAFASAVAAMKCRNLGGRAGIPSREDALAFLRERRTAGPWDPR